MSIQTESKGDLVILSINRPDALNALNQEILQSLDRILQESLQNPKVKGLIVTGEGEKAFVAGADIKEIAALAKEKALEFSKKGQKLFKMLEDSPKPIIALVNGFALGGGCELAMACHIRVATANAKFGLPEVNLGIIPGYGGTQRMAQLVGRGKALELAMTGDMITAEEAKQLCLVNHVAATKAEALELAEAIMKKILAKGPQAIAALIRSVNAGFGHEKSGYEAEAENFASLTTTRDFIEGTTAFLEKRKPSFKGE